MGSYFVLQPNGLLGRFSTVVDDFTHVNLTREEALEVYVEGELESVRRQAEAAVERGLKDELPHQHGNFGDGTARWKRAISTVQTRHGKLGRKRIEALVAEGKPAKP